MFGLAFTIYPNRELLEASCAVVLDGVVHAVRASGALDLQTGIGVGPLSMRVVDPMAELVASVTNDQLSVDLSFTADSDPVEMDRLTRPGAIPTDLSRYGQSGYWTGTVRLPQLVVEVADWRAWRRRQWGHAPAGRQPERGAPLQSLPEEYHLCLAALDVPGPPRLVLLDDGEPSDDRGTPSYELTLTAGTRRPAHLTWPGPDGDAHFEPVLTLPAHLLGGISTDWPAGGWKGSPCISHRVGPVDGAPPGTLDTIHHHQFGSIHEAGSTTPAFLESLILGDYDNLGLHGWTEGADPT
jgi:hypothetical protein